MFQDPCQPIQLTGNCPYAKGICCPLEGILLWWMKAEFLYVYSKTWEKL